MTASAPLRRGGSGFKGAAPEKKASATKTAARGRPSASLAATQPGVCYTAGMLQAVPLHRYTFEEYLALEEASNIKHEFLRGEIYAMAGGTPEHAALGVAVSAALLTQLRGGKCRVYSSDLRLRVLATGLATYPDVTVVCGPSERDPANRATVLNPRVVIEVLSPSTEDYDRGEKLDHYKQIPSLAAVVLVDYGKRRIESHQRATDGTWRSLVAEDGATLPIEAVGAQLEVDAIYDDAEEPT